MGRGLCRYRFGRQLSRGLSRLRTKSFGDAALEVARKLDRLRLKKLVKNDRKFGRQTGQLTGREVAKLSIYWLGRLDSNQGMAESKSAALPLGYAPPPGGPIVATHESCKRLSKRGAQRAALPPAR
jgi:hypothetical protein